MISDNSPRVGSRISFQNYKGTIRYIGEVDGTKGIWLGVEWDDPSRGKHSGAKDGKQYFSCLISGSGSFLRPTSPISYGRSMKDALYEKYVEVPHAHDQKETVILGSSNGIIEVEAVGLDKVRTKLAKLERLRQISLNDMGIAYADPPGTLANICPNVRDLDLSDNLISTWSIVAKITIELRNLKTLTLNRNRITIPEDTRRLSSAFVSLEELRLNRTFTTWMQVISLLSSMPHLCVLELGYNSLDRLNEAADGPSFPGASKLEVLNLDSNELCDWKNIMHSLSSISTLRWLVLTANSIQHIPIPEKMERRLEVTHLGLQANRLSKWGDLDALNAWIPNLQSLNIGDNPLIAETSGFRQFAVAKLPSLLTLNGTEISTKDRTDCEIFYLSHVARSSYASDEDRSREHPRWNALCGKYGKPEETTHNPVRDTLGHRLISINVYRIDDEPPKQTHAIRDFVAQLPVPLPVRVLPTMGMRSFRLKLAKALKISAPSGQGSPSGIWLLMDDGFLSELNVGREATDLAWWGIQDGSRILVHP